MTLWRCRRRTESCVYSDCGLGSGQSPTRLASGGRAAGPRGRSGGGEGGKSHTGPVTDPGPSRAAGGMVAKGKLLGLLWQRVVTGAALESRRQLYMSSRRADCNRASLTRVHRQTYARLYPVLLVKQDGSTIHIRYREPRRMLTMPVDLDSLSPEERRARFRKREAQVKEKEEEPELGDDFDVEQYKQFWTKK
eukprot:bmy_03328T0